MFIGSNVPRGGKKLKNDSRKPCKSENLKRLHSQIVKHVERIKKEKKNL